MQISSSWLCLLRLNTHKTKDMENGWAEVNDTTNNPRARGLLDPASDTLNFPIFPEGQFYFLNCLSIAGQETQACNCLRNQAILNGFVLFPGKYFHRGVAEQALPSPPTLHSLHSYPLHPKCWGFWESECKWHYQLRCNGCWSSSRFLSSRNPNVQECGKTPVSLLKQPERAGN